MTQNRIKNALCAILVAALATTVAAQTQTTAQGKAMSARLKATYQSAQSDFPYVVGGINAKTTGASNILPLPKGNYNGYVVTGIRVETTAATAITGGAAITIGSTATSANSILASTTLSSAPVVGGYESFNPKAGASVIGNGDLITFTIGTAATGTSQTLRVHLIGYMF
jgi:hypothetical protein